MKHFVFELSALISTNCLAFGDKMDQRDWDWMIYNQLVQQKHIQQEMLDQQEREYQRRRAEIQTLKMQEAFEPDPEWHDTFGIGQ